MSDDLPPDQLPGAPHPRDTATLFGQAGAERAFLDAFASDRLHHAWLLTGPRGIGKATLAWRIARFLLATPPAHDDGLFGAPPPPTTLDIAPDHPVSRRMAAGSEGGLALISRSQDDKTKRWRTQIVVDDIRRLNRFFGMSATDGGHRVVIVDCTDDMNTHAANALLKTLEEPPPRATLLLIAHQPAALLPTIRSRCRTLRLSPLGPDDMLAALDQTGAERPDNPEHLAVLADGSVGTALRLMAFDGLRLYRDLVAVLDSLPRLDRPRALALADAVTAREAGGDRFDMLLGLLETAMARLARSGAAGTPPLPEAAPGEAQMLARLSSNANHARAWADASAAITARLRHGQAVNLDPAALVLDTVFRLQETAPR